MSYTNKNKICDCGRKATHRLGNARICQRCYNCEKRGIGGGPMRGDRLHQDTPNSQLPNSQLLNS